MSMQNPAAKRILVTGGNSGLGLATAGQLARLGHRVTISSRDPERAAAAQAAIKQHYGASVDSVDLDLADFDSIRACAATLRRRGESLDVLVNNAGLSLSDRRETRQGFEYVLGVNTLGTQMLTQLLLDGVMRGERKRIVMVSSAAHVGARKGMDWDDLQRQHRYSGQAYCQAKLALIYYSRELARRYCDQGVEAFAVNPGFVTTRHGLDGDTRGIAHLFFRLGKLWMQSADQGAEISVWAATDPALAEHSGAYLKNMAVADPSPRAQDDAAAARWWDLSHQWIAQGHPG